MFLLTDNIYKKYNLYVQRSSMYIMIQDDGFGNLVQRNGMQQFAIQDFIEEDLH